MCVVCVVCVCVLCVCVCVCGVCVGGVYVWCVCVWCVCVVCVGGVYVWCVCVWCAFCGVCGMCVWCVCVRVVCVCVCVCVLVLVIRRAMRMRRTILSSVACLALSYFITLSHKRHDFFKKMNTKCVFSFPAQLLSETFLILIRKRRYITINVHWSSHKVPVVLFRF